APRGAGRLLGRLERRRLRMSDPRETDRLPPGLVRALRDLPRERAAPGFTRRVLGALGDRPAGGFRTALSTLAGAPRRLRVTVASAVTGLAVTAVLALALAGPVRE